MREIYTYSQTDLNLDLSNNSNAGFTVDATPTVGVYDSAGVLIDTLSPQSDLYSNYTVTIPIYLTTSEGVLRVRWSYSINGNTIVQDEFLSIVTPYISLDDLRSIVPDSFDDNNLVDLEKRIRSIIDTFCGQSFGKVNKTVVVTAPPEGPIILPGPVVSITSIMNTSNLGIELYPTSYILDSSNTVLMPVSNYFDNWEDIWVTGPIVAPLNYNQPLYSVPATVNFQITGIFGWQYVPTDINLCAKLLAKQFTCQDDIYRTKQVVNVGSNTWTLEFSPKAAQSTGNIDVDKILSQYLVPNIQVI